MKFLLILTLIIGGSISCSIYVIQNSKDIKVSQETKDGIIVETTKGKKK